MFQNTLFSNNDFFCEIVSQDLRYEVRLDLGKLIASFFIAQKQILIHNCDFMVCFIQTILPEFTIQTIITSEML